MRDRLYIGLKMKKLIRYIFWLLTLISFVYITKEVINFSKDIISLREYQTEAAIKQQKMLHPAVRILNIQENFEMYVPTGGYDTQSMTEVEFILSTASGFSIQYNPVDNISFIITNDHFCSEIMPRSVLAIENYKKTASNISNDYIPSKVLYTDYELDLCLVAASGFIKPAIIADVDYQPELFEKVFIVGGPTGNFPIIIDTYISGTSDRTSIMLGGFSQYGNDFLLISEQIFPGHSGSPVFNQEGEVIGIVFAALETYGGFAISHKDIFELLYRYQNAP